MSTSGRSARRAPVMSWALAGATVLALAPALVLLGLNDDQMAAGRIGTYAILAVAAGLYAGTGRLITSRLPGNAIGWLLALIGLAVAVTLVTEQYALYGLATALGSVPAAKLAGWLSGTVGLDGGPGPRARAPVPLAGPARTLTRR